MIKIAKERADLGHELIVNPELHIKDTRREKVLSDAFEGKNPDIRENGVLIEIETPRVPLKRRSLANRITQGSKQASVVLLNLEEDFGEEQLLDLIKGRFENLPDLIKIIVRMKGKYTDYDRS